MSSKILTCSVSALLGLAAPVASGVAQELDPAGGRKMARAVRVEAGGVRLDGQLDDRAWDAATPITDFVQLEPVEGAEPFDRMEVRFLFDDRALWIGARMESGSADIRAPLGRRDQGAQAEYLQIELDTYLDRRTAYMFGVTAAGVRLDHYHSSDNERDSDSGFDPVWEARTTVDEAGWTAELWLPFSQLRFNDVAEAVWGLNVKRWVPTTNEEVYWAPVLRTERGWSSRFGELRGIENVRPRRRLELLPYVAASSRVNGSRDLADPFDDGLNRRQRVGGDVKIGIGSNLTLEATVNPDFGQVEADPAEVNLSAFETFFDEKRPFFLEGNDLLQGETNNYFYSRRIGARPSGEASGDYVLHPDTTTILGAAKLTGRLASGTSVGALAAVTGEEFARTSDQGQLDRTRVAPQGFWGVARVQQEFGDQGSSAGAHVTAVHRGLEAGDPMSARLVGNAFTGGADARLRFFDRTYEASLAAGFSYVDGAPAAIERLQRANTHLFQRPDRRDVRLDPTRRSLGGMQVRARLDKIAGRHWLWGSNVTIESPEFETNDIGRLTFAGDVESNVRLRYRETLPGRLFRSYSLGVSSNSTSYFDRDLGVRPGVDTDLNFTFHNFWNANLSVDRDFRGQDVQLTRGGPSMGTPQGWSSRASLRNGSAPATQWRLSTSYRRNEHGDVRWGREASLSLRPAPAWRLSLRPEYVYELDHRQYLTTLDGGRPETYGQRYVFGTIDRTTLSMQIRVDYTFKPDLTLEVYAEPFAASGRYEGFGELAAPRSRALRTYGEEGTGLDRLADGSFLVTDGPSTFALDNEDFNVRSFRSNLVLRWEWRPGSTLFVVWQQNRESETARGGPVGGGDLFGSFSAPGDNVFAVKTTWWLSR